MCTHLAPRLSNSCVCTQFKCTNMCNTIEQSLSNSRVCAQFKCVNMCKHNCTTIKSVQLYNVCVNLYAYKCIVSKCSIIMYTSIPIHLFLGIYHSQFNKQAYILLSISSSKHTYHNQFNHIGTYITISSNRHICTINFNHMLYSSSQSHQIGTYISMNFIK